MKAEVLSHQIKVQGLVQGVGFRPFIYRIAIKNSIFGSVDNRNDGVFILAQGDKESISNFISEIKKLAPEASNITDIEINTLFLPAFSTFEIVKSKEDSDASNVTEISPDIAVCNDCLLDLKKQKHRINYPFINCTNCGPRFSIIQNLPYDRHLTTMKPFVMCAKCKSEYEDKLDRRFHAQPVACNDCGPTYQLNTEKNTYSEFEIILPLVQEMLNDGKVIAVKGIGGYHLFCDAFNELVVRKIRSVKLRDGKPLAVLCSSIEVAKNIADISIAEEKALLQWRKPIVLVNSKIKFPDGVQMGFKTIGIMLPYMPLHHLIFENNKSGVLVATSGNPSDSPIFIDDNLAERFFTNKVDAILSYNRSIYNRCDDSVTFIANNQERIIRRSRSYAPSPIRLSFNVDGILAVGAELNNTFCIGKGSQAIISQHIGDLKNPETLEFFEESIARYSQMFRFKPNYIVCDLHPDYLSTKYAFNAEIQVIQVQHHHAHIASVMAENNLDEKVIGLAFDGTGLGTDGRIWGAEFMLCDFVEFERLFSFKPLLLPGGDKVTKEPWRIALACLYQLGIKKSEILKFDFLKNIEIEKIDFIFEMIEKEINCPQSSSLGRIFDAIAALIDVCSIASFQAEAPMRLENLVDYSITNSYEFEIMDNLISLDKMFFKIIEELKVNTSKELISSKFHNTIVEISVDCVKRIYRQTSLKNVALSGGSFQNKYLCSKIENRLQQEGFKVYVHRKVPANDGGLSLGQLAIAAHQIQVFNKLNQ